jgi:hypothetical protein
LAVRNIFLTLVLLFLPLGGLDQGPADAQQVSGLLAVRAVTGQAGGTRDWELALAIRQRLAQDSELGPLNPSVQVRAGVATLSGPVPSHWFRRRAEELVRATSGVHDVRNELVVGGFDRQPAAAPRNKSATVLARLTNQFEPEPAQHRLPPAAQLGSLKKLTPHPNPPPQGGRERIDLVPPGGRESMPDWQFAVAYVLRNNPRFQHIEPTYHPDRLQLTGRLKTQGDREDLINALNALDQVPKIELAVVVE